MSEILIGVSACLLRAGPLRRRAQRGDGIRLVGSAGVDHTDAMRRWAASVMGELRERDLSGFVLKKGSPSSGLERVRVRDERLGPLNDPSLREHFVDRIFGHARVRDFLADRWTAGGLIRFHSAEKAAVLPQDVEAARRLGRLVAGQSQLDPEQLTRSYRALHGAAFEKPATPGRQANALMHLAGHLKGGLGSCDRQELREAIEDYRVGLIPVAVPLALLSRHLRATGTDRALPQTYLRPYPKELGLRAVISKPRRGRAAAPSERSKSPSPPEIERT